MLSPQFNSGDKMTYPNDSDPALRNRRVEQVNQVNYSPWIIGGLAALAVIVGVFFMSRNSGTDTASNVDRGTVTAPMNAPSTTSAPSTMNTPAVPAAPVPQAPVTTGAGTVR